MILTQKELLKLEKEMKSKVIEVGEFCGNGLYAWVPEDQVGAFKSAWNSVLKEKSLLKLNNI